MKQTNKKKGFTIVELVIVIAVIGILSAVLIPTFSGLVNKANETAKQEGLRNAYTTYASQYEYEAGNDLYSQEDVVFVAKADGTYTPAVSETAATFVLNADANVYVYGTDGKYADNGAESLAVAANYIGEFNGYYAFHK